MPRCRYSLAAATAAAIVATPLAAQPVPPAAVTTEKISVTADPLERDISRLAQPAAVLSDEDLRKKRATTLGETLSKEPGIQSSAFGAGAGRPIIRGLDGPRIKVLENGLGTLDVSTLSPDHMVTTDSLIASQIEILRGPATLVYGGGAIGGLVNLVTNRIPRIPVSAPAGNAELRADSASGERSLFADLTTGTDRFAFHVDGFKRKTSDYDIPGRAFLGEHDENPSGRLPNSFTDTRSGSAGGSIMGSWGYAGASTQTLDSSYGIPGEEAILLDLKQTRTDFAAEWKEPGIGIRNIRFKLGRNDYQHREIEPEGEIGTVFKNKATESRLEVAPASMAGWDTAWGLQWNDRDFSAAGEEAIVPFTRSRGNAFFLTGERKLGDTVLSLGARHERERHRPEGDHPTRNFSPATISAGLQWSLSKQTRLAVNLTQAERAPAIEELYSLGAHPATRSYEIGNAGLAKERSRNIDLTLSHSSGSLSWKISVYQNRFSNYIYGAFTDNDGDGVADRVDEEGALDPNGELTVLRFTQEGARFRGFEAELSTQLSTTLSLRIFADQTRGRLSSGANLPRMSPTRLGVELGWTHGPWSASLDTLRVLRQSRTAELETVTAGYTRVDVEIARRLSIDRAEATLFLQGRNLLNEEMRVHTSHLKDFAPLPGRSLVAGLRVKF